MRSKVFVFSTVEAAADMATHWGVEGFIIPYGYDGAVRLFIMDSRCDLYRA